MSGLDAKEIFLSTLYRDEVCSFRLESEYYSKIYDDVIKAYDELSIQVRHFF